MACLPIAQRGCLDSIHPQTPATLRQFTQDEAEESAPLLLCRFARAATGQINAKFNISMARKGIDSTRISVTLLTGSSNF